MTHLPSEYSGSPSGNQQLRNAPVLYQQIFWASHPCPLAPCHNRCTLLPKSNERAFSQRGSYDAIAKNLNLQRNFREKQHSKTSTWISRSSLFSIIHRLAQVTADQCLDVIVGFQRILAVPSKSVTVSEIRQYDQGREPVNRREGGRNRKQVFSAQ